MAPTQIPIKQQDQKHPTLQVIAAICRTNRVLCQQIGTKLAQRVLGMFAVPQKKTPCPAERITPHPMWTATAGLSDALDGEVTT